MYNQSLANRKKTCIKLLQNKHNTIEDNGVISNPKNWIQITMDFWMTKFGLYFQKFQSWSFLVELIFSPPNMYNKEFLKWAAFHMDFINWLIITQGPLNIDFQCLFPL
jgi:hypothetical protein